MAQADFTKFHSILEHIPETAAALKASGKKLVGVTPIYAPEEIIYAAGMQPFGCWGGQVDIAKATAYLPPFACSIIQAITELAMNGSYNVLDAILMSVPCDSLKCTTQNLKSACPQLPQMICVYPQNNKLESSVAYAVKQFERVQRFMEELSGNQITEDALNRAIDVYNENRQALLDFTDLCAQKPGLVSAQNRHAVIKSRLYMDKAEHTALVKELNAALAEAPAPKGPFQKVVLAGIMAEPNVFLEVFDSLGFAIVGDELAQESRQFRTLAPAAPTGLERLARQWQNVTGECLVADPAKTRTKLIVELAQKTKADAVVFVQLKFCDPDEFDWPWVKQALDAAGIPSLNVEIDQQSISAGQNLTRLQAFQELLEMM